MSQRNPLSNPNLDLDFFTNLPSEIIIDILSRLPVRTVISCKCVCKSLLNLVETHEFAKSHLSKSVPGLAIYQCKTVESYKIFEFEDGLDLEHHELHYNLVTNFNLRCGCIHGSANVLLLLWDEILNPNPLYICNPITRECIHLHCPQEFAYSYQQVVTHGFGVSNIVGQHKVVRISHDCIRDQGTRELLTIPKSQCQVYTLGARSWRRTAPCTPLMYRGCTFGALMNGNLHWLVFDLNGCPLISCFDLETELFSTFSSPPLLLGSIAFLDAGLFALGDCLCLCDNTLDEEIVIWLMKEYGVENSWIKEFVITKFPDFAVRSCGVVCPIKVFKDGDILMAWEDFFLFYYSEKNKTSQNIDMLGPFTNINAVLHTPTFLSLKSFELENVRTF